MKLRQRLCALAFLGVVLPLGASLVGPGCKRKQREVQYPASTADAGAPGPAPDAGAPLVIAAGDAGPQPEVGPPPGDGGTQPLDLVTMQAMQDFLKQRAKKEAKGMKPNGDFFGATVGEGGQVEQIFMIDSGRCYGVIAMGGPGVTELDIQIQAKGGLPIPLPGPVIAVDNSTGPEAAVTPCWKNPFPISFPATAVIKATRGYGPIGGQVFSK